MVSTKKGKDSSDKINPTDEIESREKDFSKNISSPKATIRRSKRVINKEVINDNGQIKQQIPVTPKSRKIKAPKQESVIKKKKITVSKVISVNELQEKEDTTTIHMDTTNIMPAEIQENEQRNNETNNLDNKILDVPLTSLPNSKGQKKANGVDDDDAKTSADQSKDIKPKDNHYEIYKGKNWKKTQNAPKMSNMKTGKAFHKTWSARMEEKELLSKLKETEKTIRDNKVAVKAANAKRKEANALRKQQNERRSEVVQVIKDPTKIKKMKKKHLRMIEKRDVKY